MMEISKEKKEKKKRIVSIWVCILIFIGAFFAGMISKVAIKPAWSTKYTATWSEELGRYIFVWMTFIGMAVALYKGGHVALDILLNYLHGTPRKILAAFDNLLIIIFAIAVTYSGASLFNVGLLQRSSAMNIPMHWVYAAVPVSGVVLLYFALRKMYKDFKADDNNNTNAQQG